MEHFYRKNGSDVSIDHTSKERYYEQIRVKDILICMYIYIYIYIQIIVKFIDIENILADYICGKKIILLQCECCIIYNFKILHFFKYLFSINEKWDFFYLYIYLHLCLIIQIRTFYTKNVFGIMLTVN